MVSAETLLTAMNRVTEEARVEIKRAVETVDNAPKRSARQPLTRVQTDTVKAINRAADAITRLLNDAENKPDWPLGDTFLENERSRIRDTARRIDLAFQTRDHRRW